MRSPAVASIVVLLAACSEQPAPAPGASEPPPATTADTDPPDAHPPDAALPAPHARFRPARDGGAATLDEKIEELEGVGYLTGSKVAPLRRGVTVFDRARVQPGMNLLTSGHAPTALLMESDGTVRHRWSCRFDRAFPDFPQDRLSKYQFGDYFRRVHLFPNGDLLAIFEGQAMVKLDAASNVLWTFDGNAHHDLDVTADGRVWTLTRRAHLVPAVHPTEPILEDFVTVLGPDGAPEEHFSILRAFMKSPFRAFLAGMPKEGDVLHTNTLEVQDGSLAGRLPAFAAGNLLVSCLMIDTIAVVDPREKVVVWAAKRDWVKQHQPTVLANGNLLLFDNLGDLSGRGRSRAIELDPVTLETVWEYGGTREAPLETETCGSAQRLANGDTLLTESDNGRAIEVTPDGEVVWEWINPHRAGPRREYIATLFEMIRLPPDFPVDWAGTSGR